MNAVKQGIDGAYEVAPSGCWLWLGGLTYNGYGRVARSGRNMMAHRYSWSLVNGPIPHGLTVDHLCFTRRCVNPAHLRLLTNQANAVGTRSRALTGALSADMRLLRCVKGHELTPENVYWWKRGRTGKLRRRCRQCSRDRDARRAGRDRLAETGSVAPALLLGLAIPVGLIVLVLWHLLAPLASLAGAL